MTEAPALDYAFNLDVLIAPALEIGVVGGATKRMIRIVGECVRGPRLSGVVLSGGAAWRTISADGIAHIHARYMVQAGDGTVIEVDNPGIRRGPQAIIERLAMGDDVEPALY